MGTEPAVCHGLHSPLWLSRAQIGLAEPLTLGTRSAEPVRVMAGNLHAEVYRNFPHARALCDAATPAAKGSLSPRERALFGGCHHVQDSLHPTSYCLATEAPAIEFHIKKVTLSKACTPDFMRFSWVPAVSFFSRTSIALTGEQAQFVTQSCEVSADLKKKITKRATEPKIRGDPVTLEKRIQPEPRHFVGSSAPLFFFTLLVTL
jgi:hypothetical protein